MPLVTLGLPERRVGAGVGDAVDLSHRRHAEPENFSHCASATTPRTTRRRRPAGGSTKQQRMPTSRKERWASTAACSSRCSCTSSSSAFVPFILIFWREHARLIAEEGAGARRCSFIGLSASFPCTARWLCSKSVKGLAKFAALANALIFLAIGIVLFSAAAAMRQDASTSRQYAVAKPRDATLVFWHGRLLVRGCVQHAARRKCVKALRRRLAHPLRGHVCGGGVLRDGRSFLLRGLARRPEREYHGGDRESRPRVVARGGGALSSRTFARSSP